MLMLLPCCSDFGMSQATATTTNTPPVTIVHTGASTATKAFTTASTSVGRTGVLVQNDMVLPPQLNPVDTVRNVSGFAVL